MYDNVFFFPRIRPVEAHYEFCGAEKNNEIFDRRN